LARTLSYPFWLFGWRSAGDFLLYCLFVGGFVVTLTFFSFIDVYDNHFFQSDWAATYNAFRVMFAAYFFWLVYVVGRQTLTFVAGGLLVGIRLHERLALGFFVGAALLTIVMLVLGYLYLYWRVVAAAIAIPIIATSYRHFVLVVHEAKSSIVQSIQDSSRTDRISSVVMVIAAIFSGAVLLLVKGLYPQGSHDYYQHYSHFYAAVVDNHNIWPNLFWYEYHYSKGMGVTFLGMLLTDALAPSLVAYCFAVATALALYSLVRRFCSHTLWPWLAVVLYLALNVHTLGTGGYEANGGWGHFQKPHEINSPLMIAVLWMSVNMVRSVGDIRRVWWFGATACAFVVAYILIVSPVIIGLFAVFAALYFFSNREVSRSFLGIAASTGVGLASLLVLNYLTTGAPADVAPDVWWPIVDLRRLNDEGMLFDFVNVAVIRARGAVEGSALTDNFNLIEYVQNVARLDILGILIVAALIGGLAWMIYRDVLRRRSADDVVAISAPNLEAAGVVAAFFSATAVFTFTAGMLESISYVRISSFLFPLMIAIAAIVGQIITVSTRWSWRSRILAASGVPILLISVLLVQAYEQHKTTLLAVVHNALRFAGGRYSVYDAYRDQAGWPALVNSTAIYPGMYEAWKKIGPGKRIWSFHIFSYCMLPGCHVESMLASSMTKYRAEIMFGPPENAEQILRREGLNYFFVSTRIPIQEVLQCTRLFSPDTIQNHLDVAWTDGTDVLLTWKGQGGEPLSREWLEKYRQAIKPNRYLSACGNGEPTFGIIGRRVADEVAKGRRWGFEIALPK
jgi:hypothetical protein